VRQGIGRRNDYICTNCFSPPFAQRIPARDAAHTYMLSIMSVNGERRTWEFIGRGRLGFRVSRRRQLTTTTMASRIALNSLRASGTSLRSRHIFFNSLSLSISVAYTTSCGRPANPLCVRLFLPALRTFTLHPSAHTSYCPICLV
jgi:hypothetical protein